MGKNYQLKITSQALGRGRVENHWRAAGCRLNPAKCVSLFGMHCYYTIPTTLEPAQWCETTRANPESAFHSGQLRLSEHEDQEIKGAHDSCKYCQKMMCMVTIPGQRIPHQSKRLLIF